MTPPPKRPRGPEAGDASPPRRLGPHGQDTASALYLLAGLLYRFAWVGAGRTSACDDLAVARAARAHGKQPA